MIVGRALRRRHVAPAGHPVRAAGDPADRLPARTTAPGRTSRCASTRSRTSASSTPATSRCRPASIERRARSLEEAVYAVAAAGAVPLVLGGDHSIALPGRDRRGPAPRLRPGLDDPLRRARRHRRHRVRLALRPRPADAPADRVRRAARRPVPPDGAARLLARPGDARLDGRAEHALLRDDRDRQARPRRLPRRGLRDRPRRLRRGLPLRRHRRLRPRPRARAPGRPSPAGCPRAQLLDAVRRICRELPVAGIDVVEVSPPYDHAEITAFLANRVCLEALSGLAARKLGITHDPAGPLLEGR